MPGKNRLLLGLCAGLLLATMACTSNALDDAGGPNVVLEVTDFTAPIVKGTQQAGSCLVDGDACLDDTDCDDGATTVGLGDTCDLPVTGQGCQPVLWNVTLANVPKTASAVSSPFNDVTMTHMTVVYTWPNGFPSSVNTVPLGISIPANETADISFPPISEDQLLALELFLGTGGSASATLNFTFNGVVQDSDAISVQAGNVLTLQNCLRASP